MEKTVSQKQAEWTVDPAEYAAALIGAYMFPNANRLEMVIEAARKNRHLPTEYLVAVYHEINKQLDA